MAVSSLDLIPPERRDVAADALKMTFGDRRLTGLSPISGGASGALIYRAEVEGQPFLLRLETAIGAGMREPRRGYACMSAAADVGVAPRLHFADAETGAAIMDFVVERPLSSFPGGRLALIEGLGRLLSRVQAIKPLFPAPRAPFPALVDFMLGAVGRSPLFEAGLLEPHLRGLAQIRLALGAGLPEVSSHNDPNPRNILFDGERLWLVDWELAFRNDPLVDVAILANEFAPGVAEADLLLRSVAGYEPDAALRARLTLSRRLVRAFYACMLLGPFAARRGGPPDDLTCPTVEGFRADVARGRLKLGSPELIYAYGKMQLAGFLDGLSAPEHLAALARLGGG